MKLFIVAAILGVCLADRLDNKYLPPRGNAGAGGFGPGFGASGTPAFSGGRGGAGGFGGGAGGYNAGGAGGAGGLSGTQYAGNVYNAPASQYNAPGGQYNAPGGQYNAPAGQYAGGRGGAASVDANAEILRQNSEVTAEGFSYDFETSNGIRAEASGVATNGVQSQGSFAYKGDDGQDYSITYTADENGYQPQGAHLPTPPPIPEAILKSLEQNARDEAAGISDDGTYRGEGAGSGGYPSGGAGGYSGNGAGAGYSGATGAGGAGGSFGSGGAGGYGGAAGGRGSSSFGGAASRQYLAPNAGGSRGSGSGNFNAQSGYRY